MTSRSLPKVLFAVLLCAGPVDVSAQPVELCPHKSLWTPFPEELIKFKTGTTKDRPNFCKADLTGADLSDTDLSGAHLMEADLSGADLSGAFLNFAKLIDANLTGADLLQKSGLREDERKLTYALERGKTDRALTAWKQEFPRAAEGVFRLIAFDWTTAYGLHPARALNVLLLVWALLIPVYWWPIRRQSPKPTAGIFRIWPKDRIELKKSSTFLSGNEGERDGEPILQKDGKVERLQARSLMAIAWAAWFSLLSAFQIGFREFSVGNWLTRVHPRQFTLEPTGWVRTVAGVQSLLSVYLLAMWVLTYFGRPFQ